MHTRWRNGNMSYSATYQRLAAALLVLLVLAARALYVAAPSLAASPTGPAVSVATGMLCALALLGTAGVTHTIQVPTHPITCRLDAGQRGQTHGAAGRGLPALVGQF